MFFEELIPIIAVAGFWTAVIVFVYMYFTSRNRIRMALIERDKDAGIFRKTRDRSLALRNGLVGVMVGVGILLGYQLEQLGVTPFVAYLSMVFIFGGLGLIAYYLYAQKKLPEEREIV
jgi:hypothetical protein